MTLLIPAVGGFAVPGAAGVDATVFTRLIPPYSGPAGPAPFSATAPKFFPEALTVVNAVLYNNGDTAHVLTILRPLNYTYLTAAVAANGTVINLFDDPGAYSTNYKYAIPGGKPANVANNLIAGNDYVAVQLVDGSWHVSKVASVSSLAVTLSTALPNITGGGAAAGALVYFFGITTDTDPAANGLAHPNITAAASVLTTWSDNIVGIVRGLHYGDPLLFYSPMTTHLGTLWAITGHYSKY